MTVGKGFHIILTGYIPLDSETFFHSGQIFKLFC